ncbi:hypothetical protein K8R43_05680, partial [archaeon]|nr:hypothetical protein [archaeon]
MKYFFPTILLIMLLIVTASADVGCSITVNDYNMTSGSIGSTAYTQQNGSGSAPLISNYTVTCYQSLNYTCTFTRNITAFGINSPNVTNASFNYISSNASWNEGSYGLVHISCTNGTYTNTSSNTTLVVDTVDPALTLTRPLNTTYASGTSVTLNFTYSETNAGNCTYSLDGGGNVTIGYVNGTVLSGVSGYHTLLVWCNDSAGNW